MIPRYQRILYATDLSENAVHAFRHVIGIARRDEARVHILHVLPEITPAVLNDVATAMGEDRLADLELAHKAELATKIRTQLDAFARQELAEDPGAMARIEEVAIHHGQAVSSILAEADRIDADLIVIGSHGKGAIKYAFLGSVSEKILHRAMRPVLVVPLLPE